MDKIRVLVADDSSKIRENIRDLLALEDDIEVIGEAINGEEAVKKADRLLPDIILMDLNMPVMNGITATEKITVSHPNMAVIVISIQGDAEYFKKAMAAGARDYLVKPFNLEELASSIRKTNQATLERTAKVDLVRSERESYQHKIPQVITVFGTKGGSGKTTLSTNLAVQLAKSTRRRVVLIDLDLQFGDVAVFLNIIPKRSIAELVQEKNKLDYELISSYLIQHLSGIRILPAPIRPELAELIDPEYIMELLTALRLNFDYIVIDTPPFFHDTVLSALDMSNQILMVMSMDIPSVKNLKLSLDVLNSLHYRGKVKLILNRASDDFGLSVDHVEKSLETLIAGFIPSDGKLAVKAANRGIPFIISNPNSKISEAIINIADLVVKDRGYQNDLQDISRKKSMLSRFFK